MSRASVAGHRVYAIDGTDQPVDEVDVVAGLVHEGAAVEFPSATPLGGVVVFLRTGREEYRDSNSGTLPPCPNTFFAFSSLMLQNKDR